MPRLSSILVSHFLLDLQDAPVAPGNRYDLTSLIIWGDILSDNVCALDLSLVEGGRATLWRECQRRRWQPPEVRSNGHEVAPFRV